MVLSIKVPGYADLLGSPIGIYLINIEEILKNTLIKA
jgi:hypothetical protein